VVIPRDEEIFQYDLEARPLVELPEDSKAVIAINALMDEILSSDKVVA
jgi:CO dehydrogenase maturation factor